MSLFSAYCEYQKNEHTAACRVKSISYLDNILAKQEAKAQQYDEAILLNTSLNVADGGNLQYLYD